MLVNQVRAMARVDLYDSSAPFVSNKCQNIFRENSIVLAEHHSLRDLEIGRCANDGDFERTFALMTESRYNLICNALIDIGKKSALELFNL